MPDEPERPRFPAPHGESAYRALQSRPPQAIVQAPTAPRIFDSADTPPLAVVSNEREARIVARAEELAEKRQNARTSWVVRAILTVLGVIVGFGFLIAKTC